MRTVRWLAIAATVTAIASCTPQPTQPKPLAGKYQAEDASAGIEFLDNNKARLYDPQITQGIETGYEVSKDGKQLTLVLTGSNTVFNLEQTDDQFTLKSADPNASIPQMIFRKVDTFTLKADTGSQRAVQAEAKNYIGSMNRANQAYILEYGEFAPTLEALRIGIKPETEHYRYQLLRQGDGKTAVMNLASAKQANTKSYIGLVYVDAANPGVTKTQVCTTDQPLATPPEMPALPTGDTPIACPSGSQPLNP